MAEGFSLEEKDNQGNTAFLSAACNCSTQLLKFLKGKGADINVYNNYGQNALMNVCSYSNDVDAVGWLLPEGFNLEEKNDEGDTVFLCAAQNENIPHQILCFLKGKSADIKVKNNNGQNALMNVCSGSCDTDSINWLLAEGFNLEENDNQGNTAFLSATCNGSIQLLKFLKGKGADIKVHNNYGQNALMNVCSYSNDIDAVEWLLTEGFDLEDKNNKGNTVFLCAAQNENIPFQILSLLKHKGADIKVKNKDGQNALMNVCSGSCDIETVKWLLAEGFNLEEKDNQGNTVFLSAVWNGCTQLLKFLKIEGADIKDSNKNGENALMRVCSCSRDIDAVNWLWAEEFNLEEKNNDRNIVFLCAAQNENIPLQILRLLQDKGAEMKVRNKNGQTALTNVCYGSGDIETVKWMLAEGFNLEEKDNLGQTAFLCAAWNGNTQLLNFLKGEGADIKAKNKNEQNALMNVCSGSGNTDAIKWLLAEGFSLKEKDNQGNTAFLSATCNGSRKLLKFLKGKGADTKVHNKYGQNALMNVCSYSNDIDAVKWLLKEGFDLEEKNDEGDTAFLCAAQNENIPHRILCLLEDEGADTNVKNNNGQNALMKVCSNSCDFLSVLNLSFKQTSLKEKDNEGNTVFLIAAENDKLPVLHFLHYFNHDIEVENNQGQNALIRASLGRGNIDIVKWLLCMGLDIDKEDNDGNTAFLCTAQKGNTPLLSFLKCKNANIYVYNSGGENALVKASLGRGNIDTVKWLLAEGFQVNEKDFTGDTAFHNAAWNGDVQLIKFLKRENADINVCNYSGKNALMYACTGSCDIEAVKWLLEEGFNLEDKDSDENTAFLLATKEGNVSFLKFLKDEGADIKVRNKYGQNALMNVCFSSGDIEVVKWLLEEGFTLEEKDNDGNTSFLFAAQNGNTSILKFLKDENASVTVKNNLGENALMKACLNSNNFDAIKWPLQGGLQPPRQSPKGYSTLHDVENIDENHEKFYEESCVLINMAANNV